MCDSVWPYCVLVPPLVRYLVAGCCAAQDHCSNRTEEGYGKKLLNKLEHARSVIKGEVTKLGKSNIWVSNGVGLVLGKGTGWATTVPDLQVFGPVCGKDGVHLTDTGYRNLSSGIIEDIKNPYKKTAASEIRKSAYWRGFISPVGSAERTSGSRVNARWWTVGATGSGGGDGQDGSCVPSGWKASARKAHPYWPRRK